MNCYSLRYIFMTHGRLTSIECLLFRTGSQCGRISKQPNNNLKIIGQHIATVYHRLSNVCDSLTKSKCKYFIISFAHFFSLQHFIYLCASVSMAVCVSRLSHSLWATRMEI